VDRPATDATLMTWEGFWLSVPLRRRSSKLGWSVLDVQLSIPYPTTAMQG
jgi:hypothetical protein